MGYDPNTDTQDLTQAVVAGSFTAVGQSGKARFVGLFNVTLSGTFSASVRLERSFDGTTWHPCTNDSGAIVVWGSAMSIVCDEPERGVRYRLNCTSYTSGTLTYRISQ